MGLLEQMRRKRLTPSQAPNDVCVRCRVQRCRGEEGEGGGEEEGEGRMWVGRVQQSEGQVHGRKEDKDWWSPFVVLRNTHSNDQVLSGFLGVWPGEAASFLGSAMEVICCN